MKQEYQDYMLQQLKALMDIDSPSGYTHFIQQYMNEELARLGFQPKNPVKGGTLAHLGGEGAPILLMAHVDTLGGMVTTVKENGRLMFTRIGGVPPCSIDSTNVKIKTRFNGEYPGTVQLMNPSVHVNPDSKTTVRDLDTNVEIVLDADVHSAADVAALGIRPGDHVAFDPNLTFSANGYIKSRFLDDKACVAIALALAKKIADEKLQPRRSVWVNFTIYEEVGHGGAHGIPEGIEEALSLDMGCVGDGLQGNEHKVSICAKDAASPYNYEVTTALLKTAIDLNLNHAIDVYRSYSSDSDVTLKAGYDVKHGLIGPGIYASHGYERTHIDGLTNTFELLCGYLL